MLNSPGKNPTLAISLILNSRRLQFAKAYCAPGNELREIELRETQRAAVVSSYGGVCILNGTCTLSQVQSVASTQRSGSRALSGIVIFSPIEQQSQS